MDFWHYINKQNIRILHILVWLFSKHAKHAQDRYDWLSALRRWQHFRLLGLNTYLSFAAANINGCYKRLGDIESLEKHQAYIYGIIGQPVIVQNISHEIGINPHRKKPVTEFHQVGISSLYCAMHRIPGEEKFLIEKCAINDKEIIFYNIISNHNNRVTAYEIPSQYYSNKMDGRNLYVIEGITGSKELFYNDQTFLTNLGQLTADIHTFITPTDIPPDHPDFSPLNIDDKQIKIKQLFHHIHSTNHPFTTEMRETINDIGRILSKWNLISDFFKKQRKVFCHNDLSRKNLIHTNVHGYYKFGIYDWGASRFSLPGTDLATHFSNNIFTKLSPQEILSDTRAKILLKIYYNTMKQEFPHISTEEIEISTDIMFLANYIIRAVQKSNHNRFRHAVYRGLRAIEMLS